jgi:hypothetical protein
VTGETIVCSTIESSYVRNGGLVFQKYLLSQESIVLSNDSQPNPTARPRNIQWNTLDMIQLDLP